MKRTAQWMTLVLMAAALGCQSTKGKSGEPMAVDPMLIPAPMVQFTPAKAVATLQFNEGRYPNLLSPNSYAVWVNRDVVMMKKDAEETETSEAMPADLMAAAERIDENFFVFECHIESAFPDASIAYDMVGLRNTDIYLDTPDGLHVRPIQRILGTSADESLDGAIKRFQRTLVLVFPKMDIVAKAPTVAADAPVVHLTLENFNSTYYFEWPGTPTADTGPHRLTAEETKQALSMGFTALYSRLRTLAHMFD